MKYLDISYIPTNYTYENIDCWTEPIAIACTYYNKRYYYYICGQYAIKNNWWVENDSYFEYINSILFDINLKINDNNVDNFDVAFEVIREKLSRNIPIFIILKYSALYYHRAYLDSRNDDIFHGIIINGYNEEKEIFFIKDRATIDVNGVIDIQIPKRILREMWEISYNNCDTASVYSIETLEAITECEIPKLNFSKLNDDVEKFNKFIEFIKKPICEDEIGLKRNYVGSLKLLFDCIEQTYVYASSDIINKMRSLEHEYIQERDKIFLNVYRQVLRGKEFTNEKKEKYIAQIIENDKKIFSLFRDVADNSECNIANTQYEKISLEEFYNNKAFDNVISKATSAKLNHRGTYLLYDMNGELQKTNNELFSMENLYQKVYDNVSCNKQVVLLKDLKREYKSLCIVGCSEMEVENGDLCIEYVGGTILKLELNITDFLRAPKYGEEIYWRGKAVKNRVEEQECSILSENARIFIQRVRLPFHGPIKSITLPLCPNIHIFGMGIES